MGSNILYFVFVTTVLCYGTNFQAIIYESVNLRRCTLAIAARDSAFKNISMGYFDCSSLKELSTDPKRHTLKTVHFKVL